MTVTSFNTIEDFDNLNKQLKFMFDHGLHKVDGAYESFGGLKAENIFKFDLEKEHGVIKVQSLVMQLSMDGIQVNKVFGN